MGRLNGRANDPRGTEMTEHDVQSLIAAVAVALATLAIVARVVLPLAFGLFDRRL